jgi:hypothetical protein
MTKNSSLGIDLVRLYVIAAVQLSSQAALRFRGGIEWRLNIRGLGVAPK